MKKKTPLVLPIALLLLATSGYSFSQSYVYRTPALGVKASLLNEGMPTPPSNGDEECYLNEEGVFGVVTASTPEAENYLNDLASSVGVQYSNPLFYVMEDLNAQEAIFLNLEDVFQPGELLFSDPNSYVDGLVADAYELYVCGEYVPETNNNPWVIYAKQNNINYTFGFNSFGDSNNPSEIPPLPSEPYPNATPHSINLMGTGINSIGGIGSINQAGILNLSDNNILEVFLPNLITVDAIWLGRNNLNNFNAPGLTSASYIDLGNNNIRNLNLPLVSNLSGIDISNNGLEEISIPNLVEIRNESESTSSVSLGLNSNNLSNVDGLSSVRYVSGHVNLSFNPNLNNIDGLGSIEYIGGSLNLIGTNVSSLLPLSNLREVGSISINAHITNSLSGLENLESIRNINISLSNHLNNLEPISQISGITITPITGVRISYHYNGPKLHWSTPFCSGNEFYSSGSGYATFEQLCDTTGMQTY